MAYGLNHNVQAVIMKKFPCLLFFRRCCGCCLCCTWATEGQQVHPQVDVDPGSLTSSLRDIELSDYSN